ncbi:MULTISPECIES: hypothetical protein [Glutamicibacter]|jgi:hypothetical protein|uniref:DNA-directed RNA polymerase subunit beta n=1 Tax=Glutamicibacter creatinolyticus TaxID=162496 RepID=A0A5B7WPP4_9MICC|nr:MULTISPECIES: hypothetical protein [Glutamicibacter]QCY45907.1 Hypothetical protein GcLGCM259_0117 [Glutamicibacter creatinolyticus]TLK54830.1 hypothetical protein FDN03_05035 [Glutamicibacter sp. V16R2B1]
MKGPRAGSKVPHDSGFRHHKPKPFTPREFEAYVGGADPARVSEAAHLSARAFVHGGLANQDPKVSARLVAVAEDEGIEVLAELWSEAPARSLPGALWRLYAIRTATLNNPEVMATRFRAGAERAEVDRIVAGAAEPPTADELRRMADSILSGAFDGDFAHALERTAAYCRVIALGMAEHADAADLANAVRGSVLTQRATALVRTAEDLEACAHMWRNDCLD